MSAKYESLKVEELKYYDFKDFNRKSEEIDDIYHRSAMKY